MHQPLTPFEPALNVYTSKFGIISPQSCIPFPQLVVAKYRVRKRKISVFLYNDFWRSPVQTIHELGPHPPRTIISHRMLSGCLGQVIRLRGTGPEAKGTESTKSKKFWHHNILIANTLFKCFNRADITKINL